MCNLFSSLTVDFLLSGICICTTPDGKAWSFFSAFSNTNFLGRRGKRSVTNTTHNLERNSRPALLFEDQHACRILCCTSRALDLNLVLSARPPAGSPSLH
ncbi:hypothetical protein BDZ85DRAFT_133503 [Elsinoe ampelina]|uniref:Secreted protein n=1 Tax=Elsinoe ampelina TaxID=302913 RepID=A0A6A6G8B0_9PEZI|nr:hypothetical protein BDZ85DRAFT_133503 [Elsinoe ampelina]